MVHLEAKRHGKIELLEKQKFRAIGVFFGREIAAARFENV